MPSKRPAPLSDAALFSGRPATAAAPAGAPGDGAVVVGQVLGSLGETNDGVPLPVKNTFIDVPSGMTPTNMQSARASRNQMLNTAPAELNVAPGFIKRAILGSSASQNVPTADVASAVTQPIGTISTSVAAPAISTSVAAPVAPQPISVATPVSPTKRGPAVVPVQRPVLDKSAAVPGSSHGVPGSSHGYTPMMTPSPTGSSLFTVHRYQLFGGPAPVTEATHSALAPGGLGSYTASMTSPLSPTRQLPSGPLTAAAASSQTSVASAGGVAPAASWPPLATHGAVQTSSFSTGVPLISAGTYSRPAHAAALQTEQMQQLKEREGEDDEDDSDDEEAQQQAQQQGAGAAKTPEEAPKPPPGAAHPSLGSDQHAEGTCKRCCFYPRNRCLNGYNCDFCHYDHEKRKRKSKKKKKKDKGADGAPSSFEACGTSMSVGLPLTAPPSATLQLTTLPAPTMAAPAHLAAMPTHPGASLLSAPGEPPPPLGIPTLAASPDGFYEFSSSSSAYGQQYAPSMATTLSTAYTAGTASTAAPLATTVSAPSYFAPATGSTSTLESQRLVLPSSEPVHLLGTNPHAARYVVPSGGEVQQALYSTPSQLQGYAQPQVSYPAPAEPHALSAGPPLYEATVPSTSAAGVPPATLASGAVSSTMPAHAPPATPPTLVGASAVYKPAPVAPPMVPAAGLWAPPEQAPNLPQEALLGEDVAPAPLEAPRAFPPTPLATAPPVSIIGAAPTAPASSMTTVANLPTSAAPAAPAAAAAAAPAAQAQAYGGPKAPPPMCSPKLPKNMVLSLQQGMPAPPGNGST